MIINNRYFGCISIIPFEYNSPLVIDPDTVKIAHFTW